MDDVTKVDVNFNDDDDVVIVVSIYYDDKKQRKYEMLKVTCNLSFVLRDKLNIGRVG